MKNKNLIKNSGHKLECNKSTYHELKIPLMNIFSQSLSTRIFPDKMKIAKVSPVFKNGKKYIASNYRPISVISC